MTRLLLCFQSMYPYTDIFWQGIWWSCSEAKRSTWVVRSLRDEVNCLSSCKFILDWSLSIWYGSVSVLDRCWKRWGCGIVLPCSAFYFWGCGWETERVYNSSFSVFSHSNNYFNCEQQVHLVIHGYGIEIRMSLFNYRKAFSTCLDVLFYRTNRCNYITICLTKKLYADTGKNIVEIKGDENWPAHSLGKTKIKATTN